MSNYREYVYEFYIKQKEAYNKCLKNYYSTLINSYSFIPNPNSAAASIVCVPCLELTLSKK